MSKNSQKPGNPEFVCFVFVLTFPLSASFSKFSLPTSCFLNWRFEVKHNTAKKIYQTTWLCWGPFWDQNSEQEKNLKIFPNKSHYGRVSACSCWRFSAANKAAMSKISAAALLQLADQFDRQKKCLDLREKVILAIGEGSLNVSYFGVNQTSSNCRMGISPHNGQKKWPLNWGREELGHLVLKIGSFFQRNQVFYIIYIYMSLVKCVNKDIKH